MGRRNRDRDFEQPRRRGSGWWRFGVWMATIIGAFVLGFYFRAKTEPEIKEKIKYVELPPVHDTISNPVPVYVKAPADTLNILLALVQSGRYQEFFPERVRDSIVYLTEKDTAAVIRDWATERTYSETLFDNDTVGTFKFDAKVQYNRLENFDYTFVPRQKQTETIIYRPRKYLPYAGAGIDTGGSVIAQGGMFFKQDAGFGVQYRYDIRHRESSVGGLFVYMF